MLTVTDLLTAKGFAPRLSFTGFALAVDLADIIARTITDPIKRTRFVANATADLVRLDYQPFEGLEDDIEELIKSAEMQEPTDQGSQGIWGNLLLLALI